MLVLSTHADTVLSSEDISEFTDLLQSESTSAYVASHAKSPGFKFPSSSSSSASVTEEEEIYDAGEVLRKIRREQSMMMSDEVAKATNEKEVVGAREEKEVSDAASRGDSAAATDAAWMSAASTRLSTKERPLWSSDVVEREIGTSNENPSGHDVLAAPSARRVDEALQHMLGWLDAHYGSGVGRM